MNNQYFGMASLHSGNLEVNGVHIRPLSLYLFPCAFVTRVFQHGSGTWRAKTAQSGIDIHLFMEYLDQLQHIVGFSHNQVMSAFSVVTESCRIPSTLKEKVAGFRTWRLSVRNQSQAVRQTIRIFLRLRITKCPDGSLENILKTGKGGRSINNAPHPRLVRAASSTSPSTCSGVPVIP